MIKRRIFKKKNYIKKYSYFLFIILIIPFFYFFYYYFFYSNYVTIPKNINHFFIIPDNPGGKIIPDYGISILENDITQNENFNNNLELSNHNFSIQLYASIHLNEIIFQKNSLLKNDFISKQDLFIGEFRSNLGNTYLLLYKIFNMKDYAKEECEKIEKVIIKCIIVNLEYLS